MYFSVSVYSNSRTSFNRLFNGSNSIAIRININTRQINANIDIALHQSRVTTNTWALTQWGEVPIFCEPTAFRRFEKLWERDQSFPMIILPFVDHDSWQAASIFIRLHEALDVRRPSKLYRSPKFYQFFEHEFSNRQSCPIHTVPITIVVHITFSSLSLMPQIA